MIDTDLGNEVRVTVIATGFSNTNEIREDGDGIKTFEVYPLKEFGPQRQKISDVSELPIAGRGVLNSRFKEDDYEIPAFLRRKAD